MYTKIFLRHAGDAISEVTIKKLRHIWQSNRTKDEGGLRLTDAGLEYVTKTLDLKVYTVPFPIDLDLKPQVLVFLDKFIDCPYHLTDKAITVLSERKGVELILFSGDVMRFGLTKAMKRKMIPPTTQNH